MAKQTQRRETEKKEASCPKQKAEEERVQKKGGLFTCG